MKLFFSKSLFRNLLRWKYFGIKTLIRITFAIKWGFEKGLKLSTFLALFFSFLDGSIAVNSQTCMIFSVLPGDSFKSSITLSNGSENAQEAKLYCSDYFFFSDGTSRFDPPGSHSKSICPWIKLSQSSITLPPKIQAETSFTVTVPKVPDLTGTYWGIIFVEPVTSPLLPPSENKVSRTIKPNVRYAIQVIVEIEKTGNYAVKVLKNELVRENDKSIIHFDVENQGSLLVQLTPSLDLFTKLGKKTKEMQLPRKMIYPSCSAHFSFDVTGVDVGEYMGFLLLDHSEEAIFGGQYPFTIEKSESEKQRDALLQLKYSSELFALLKRKITETLTPRKRDFLIVEQSEELPFVVANIAPEIENENREVESDET